MTFRALSSLPVALLLFAAALRAQQPGPGDAGPAGAQAATQTTTSRPRAERPRDAQATQALADGQAHERALRYDRAITAYHASARRAQATGDSATYADAAYRIGIVYWERNRYDSALVFLGTARDIRRRIGGDIEYARILNGIGACYYQLGVYEPAIDAFVPSVRMRRLLNDSLGLSRTLTNLGKVYHDWGQRDRARRVLDEAVEVADRASTGTRAISYAATSRAQLAVDEGDLATARRLIELARSALTRADTAFGPGDSLDVVEAVRTAEGMLMLREGRARGALARFDTALAVAETRGSIRGQSLSLLRAGEALVLLNQFDAARERFTRALTLARQVGQRVLMLGAIDHLVELERDRGATRSAFDYLLAAQALRDTIFDQDAALRIAAREAREETDVALEANRMLQATSAEQDQTIARQRTTLLLGGLIVLLSAALIVMFARLTRSEQLRARALTRANSELAQVNRDLTAALAEVNTLSGLIPICANCKKVRDDRGYWEQVETFVSNRSNATFSHSICQSCGPELYGDLWNSSDDPKVGRQPSA